MSVNQIANLQNTVPILQQERSTVTTNPFIPNEQKTIELEKIDKEANLIIEEQYKKNKSNSIFNLTIAEINKHVSSSFIGFLDDLFTKPQDVSWKVYIPMIIQKDQRYTYLGILLILVALYMLAVRR